MIKRIIKIYICVFLIIVFFCSCKEEIQLPNIKLAIDYDSYFSEYDDQLYELNEDGTLTVSLCRIRDTLIDQKLIIANDYNGEGEMTTCKFEEKKIKLTYKQKRIIFDIWSKLSEEEPFRKRDAYHYLGSNKRTDATVYIQIGDKITYACTYIHDYEKAERPEEYSPEVLGLAYRFIDFIPLEPRTEWVTGYKDKNGFSKNVIEISGITTHSHKWK